MKEKIKNWFKEWFTFFTVMAIAFLEFAIVYACIGEYEDSLCYLAIALFCVSTVIKDKRIELMKELLSDKVDMHLKLAIEQKQHFITFLRMRLFENDVEFCKRRKSCSDYLKYRQAGEEVLEDELRKLKEITDKLKDEEK